MFLAKFFRAFVGRVAHGDDLDVGMLLERGEMTAFHHFPCADNSEPKFLMIFMHSSDRQVMAEIHLTTVRDCRSTSKIEEIKRGYLDNVGGAFVPRPIGMLRSPRGTEAPPTL